MSNHRISGLADPTHADDAVTRRCVSSRFQALSDEVQDKKSKLDALQNFLGVENNQVLIRECEITNPWNIGTSYKDEEGRITVGYFFKYPHTPGKIDESEFLDIFTLKEYFIHLLEKPVDDVTWLRIKQPGTYTIHFDFIINPKKKFI